MQPPPTSVQCRVEGTRRRTVEITGPMPCTWSPQSIKQLRQGKLETFAVTLSDVCSSSASVFSATSLAASASQAASISASRSASMSASLAQSASISGSLAASASVAQAASISASNAASLSASQSVAQAASVSASAAVAQSLSASLSVSQSVAQSLGASSSLAASLSSSAAAVYATAVPGPWVAMGSSAIAEGTSGRALTGASTSSPDMSYSKCLNFCASRNFPIAGLEFGCKLPDTLERSS